MNPASPAEVTLRYGRAFALAALAVSVDALPPPPARYFNDYAGVVTEEAAARLDARLRQFDETSSNQVVVAVFPELPSPSLEDFTIRTAQSWRAGRKKLDNGVVLFVFVKDRKVRLEVGYGLEGALPDVVAKRIINERIAPAFRVGDYAAGLSSAIDAIIAATRGEYQTSPEGRGLPAGGRIGRLGTLCLLATLVILVIMANSGRRSRTYGRRGWRSTPWWWGGGGGGWSGGGMGGGWSSGGGWSGGGGFSGGGGSFGGGGASGSW